MASESTSHRSIEVVNGTSVGLVGIGIVTIALFPLALPILILTAVSLIPFLVPVVALAVVAAAIALPVMLVRGLWRRANRATRPSTPLCLARASITHTTTSDLRAGRSRTAIRRRASSRPECARPVTRRSASPR